MADLIARGADERRTAPFTVRRSRPADALAVTIVGLLLVGGVAVRSTPKPSVPPRGDPGVTRVYGSRPAYDGIAASDNLRDADRGAAGQLMSMPSAAGVRDALRDVVQQLCAGALELTVREQSISADFRRADFAVTASTYFNSIKERVSGGGFTVRISYRGGQYSYAAERRTGECRAL